MTWAEIHEWFVLSVLVATAIVTPVMLWMACERRTK